MEEKKGSRLNAALTAVTDLIAVGLLWLLASLPLVTVGAASTAAYYAVVKCIRHERGRLWASFWGSFRGNFRQSTLCWLLALAYLLLGAVNLYALGQLGERAGTLLIDAARLFFVPAAITLPWLFPYISRFENSVGGSLKFAVWLSVRHVGATLLMLLELGLFALIVWLMPLLLPLLPGPLFLLLSLRVEPALRRLTEGAKDDNPDPWYNE